MSIVTVAPSTMVTLSLLVGTTPPAHVAGALQLPPAPMEATFPGGFVAWLPERGGTLRAPEEIA